MDLTNELLREALWRVEAEGWDGAEGRALLERVRRCVVVPVVRRSGLRGPAADQAAADGWAAAWDALRRPTARAADNPGGMVWVAVRRAVASARREPMRGPSVEHLMELGWEPTGPSPAADPAGMGAVVGAVVDRLVDTGWDRAAAGDAVAMLAETAIAAPAPACTSACTATAGPNLTASSTASQIPTCPPTSTCSPASTSTCTSRANAPGAAAIARWRLVAVRLDVPQWQARRLAGLLLGEAGAPGVLELAVVHGAGVLSDEAVLAAVRSTTIRWSAGPAAWLTGWAPRSADQGVV